MEAYKVPIGKPLFKPFVLEIVISNENDFTKIKRLLASTLLLKCHEDLIEVKEKINNALNKQL